MGKEGLTRDEPFFGFDFPLPYPPPLLARCCVGDELPISEVMEKGDTEEDEEAEHDGDEGEASMTLIQAVCAEDDRIRGERAVQDNVDD